MLSANTFQIHLIAITLSLKSAKRKKPISNYNWATKPLHNVFICSLDLQASQLPYGIFYSFRHKQRLYTDVANNLLSTCTFFIFSLKHFFYDNVIAIRCTQEYYTPCELDTSPSQAHQASIVLLLSINIPQSGRHSVGQILQIRHNTVTVTNTYLSQHVSAPKPLKVITTRHKIT